MYKFYAEIIELGRENDEADNNRVAFEQLKAKAEQGDASQQYELGRWYFDGTVEKDDSEAFRWFSKAAEQGNVNANNRLAVMYLLGRGVQKNYAEAVARFLDTADKIPDSAFRLGLMYEKGLGVEKNESTARDWYSKAGKNNHQAAIQALKCLDRQIAASEIADVEPQFSEKPASQYVSDSPELQLEEPVADSTQTFDANECPVPEAVVLSEVTQVHKEWNTASSRELSCQPGNDSSAQQVQTEISGTTESTVESPVFENASLKDEVLVAEEERSEGIVAQKIRNRPDQPFQSEDRIEQVVFPRFDAGLTLQGNTDASTQREGQLLSGYETSSPNEVTESSSVAEKPIETAAEASVASSYWECHEPPANALWPKDHQANRFDLNAELFLVRRRGRSHEHDAKFCDDDGDYWVHPSGWTVMTVADGAGSAEYSREGSRIAVTTVLNGFQQWFTDEKVAECDACLQEWETKQNTFYQLFYYQFYAICKQAVANIKDLAEKNGFKERQFATTLLVTVSKVVGGITYLASLWIGDGAMAAYRRGDSRLLGVADSGDFLGQTRFLDASYLQQHYPSSVSIAAMDQVEALILMTDGVSDPKFKSDADLGDARCWDAFWQELEPVLAKDEPIQALQDWLHFFERGYHDDRTLLINWLQANKVLK